MAHHSRIQPQHGQWEPEENWEPAGKTIDGKQLWIETFKDNAPEPMMEVIRNPDGSAVIDRQTGNPKERQVYKRHPVNGEPLYPMNRRKIVVRERMFFVESQGNFNVEKHFYTPPSQEELDRAEREGKVEEVTKAFFESLVDSGIDSGEAMRRLLRYGPVLNDDQLAEAQATYESGDGVPEPTLPRPEGESPKAPDPDVEYPNKLPGKNKWELSNGSVFTGKKAEAETAELEVMQRREEMADVPAV